MRNFEAPYHLDAVAGGLLLAFEVYAKIGQFYFRKRAVAVPATVIQVFTHPRVRSHFVRYRWGNEERAAEFRTSSMRATFGPGDTLSVLIDPLSPPNDAIPDDGKHAREVAIGSETCFLPGGSLIAFWELPYLLGAAALIYFSFR